MTPAPLPPTGTPRQQREARRQAAVARLEASRLRLQTSAGPTRPWLQALMQGAAVLRALVHGHPVASAAAAAGLGALLAQLRPWRWLSALGALAGPAVVAVCTQQLAAWLSALQPKAPGQAGPAPGTANHASTLASKNA